MDPVISHCTFIAAAPETVYDALATAEGLNGWFTTGTEADPREGGRIVFRWHGFGVNRVDMEDHGPVLAAERGRRFTFQWHPAGPARPTTVDIRLAPWGQGTRVELRESGYGPSDEELSACLGCAVGWGEALTLLKYRLEAPESYVHPCRWWEQQGAATEAEEAGSSADAPLVHV
jgi:uncharacterized protein YndB with AHSA1/START domain